MRHGRYKIGQWVGYLRGNKEELQASLASELNKIGFVWDVLEWQWQEGLSYLAAYQKLVPDYNVPQRYMFYGFNLGSFVSNKRHRRHLLKNEQKKQLNDLGFVW